MGSSAARGRKVQWMARGMAALGPCQQVGAVEDHLDAVVDVAVALAGRHVRELHVEWLGAAEGDVVGEALLGWERGAGWGCELAAGSQSGSSKMSLARSKMVSECWENSEQAGVEPNGRRSRGMAMPS